MKYKILLTGNNKAIMDDLFSKTGGRFEYQTTSARYEDILSHFRHFKPDGFLYCINHEMPDSFRRLSDLKQSPKAVATAFFAVGTRPECDSYIRTVPGVADLILEKPISISSMEEKMADYFISARTHKAAAPAASSMTVPPAAANTVPAPGSQTGNPPVPNAGAVPQQTPVQPASASQTPAGRPQNTASQTPAGKPQNTASQISAGKPQNTASQISASGTPQPAVSSQPAKPVQPAAAPAPAAATGQPDPNDELLLALTEQVGQAAKVIEAVANMPVITDDSEDDPERRRHILVVDDDSRMLKIIKRHLSDKYDVATALNGRLALKFLETKKTDLILLDYEMPLENGPTILKKLRENPYTHDIPVIFLTGISERDKIEKALVMKPQGYLLKPIDHIKLLSTISKLIG